jgi:hypothetical protein
MLVVVVNRIHSSPPLPIVVKRFPGIWIKNYLRNGWHPIWAHSRTHLPNWARWIATIFSCGRLALVSICITARQSQGYRITFQLRALAGFQLRSAK